MKITITKNPQITETEITVLCNSLTPELEEIIASISLLENTVAGKKNDETFFIPLRDVLYFEAVDKRIFFYTDDGTYESPVRLYRLEEKLASTLFARISKSVIANLKKVRSIKPEENSRLLATLTSGERLVVSRQYVMEIKKKLGV